MTANASTLDAQEIIARLELERHPEGGWFAETYRDANTTDGRAHSTAIYYLLAAGEHSHWHAVDATEVWHYYAGAPLALGLYPDGGTAITHTLGPDLLAGERPQFAIPPGWWQSATSLGAWTLVGCTVAPGFTFEGFTLAPEGWTPPA